ncbi:MAG: hypothetical protein ISS78_08185 [Phycisphaerae bacterium]|nr:hypothetical protein [Phycisphaerae bacterium]
MNSLLSLISILAAARQSGSDGYRAPAVNTSIPLVAVICTLVVLAAICVLGFKSAHRTHLK